MPNINRKPSWLNKKIDLAKCREMENLLSGLNLNTVCHKALCPNIGECFACGHATFLILGDICTRACAFCGVSKGKPALPDQAEPARVAKAASKMGLKHVVVTSVTRDDLPDGGSSHFAETVAAIRSATRDAKVEILIPDFAGEEISISNVILAKPDIIGHNLETVPSLYSKARQGASYKRSLEVLKTIKKMDRKIFTKSGIMLGLGEPKEEVYKVFDDLRSIECDFLSIGQYLAPGRSHYPVKEYVAPDMFEHYKEEALKRGFAFVASGPYVRSSYLASEYLLNIA